MILENGTKGKYILNGGLDDEHEEKVNWQYIIYSLN